MKKEMTNYGVGLFIAIVLISCGGESKNIQQKSDDLAENSLESINIPEEEVSQKKSTLNKLVGEHKLSSISGLMGVNTLNDYYIENGEWIASGSTNSGGRREGYDIDLSKADLNKLKTMKIVVSEDLSLSLFCNDKEFFRTPFQEDGMSYFLKKSPKNYETSKFKNLNSTSTFIDDYLYLYAKDEVLESDISFVDILQLGADAVVLKYNFKADELELILFYGDCCDSSTYTFK